MIPPTIFEGATDSHRRVRLGLRTFGREMDWDVSDRRYEKTLNALLKSTPSIGMLVREKMAAMKKGKVWVTPNYCFETTGSWSTSATLLYYFVLYDKPELAPEGYWNRIHEKHQWPVPPQSN